MFIEGLGIWALETKMEEKRLIWLIHIVKREGETKTTSLRGELFRQVKD